MSQSRAVMFVMKTLSKQHRVLTPGTNFRIMSCFTEIHLIITTPRIKTEHKRSVWYSSKWSFYNRLVIFGSSGVLGSEEETVCKCRNSLERNVQCLVWYEHLHYCAAACEICNPFVVKPELDIFVQNRSVFFFFFLSPPTHTSLCKMLQGQKSDSPWQLACLHTTGYWTCENKLFLTSILVCTAHDFAK